MLRRMLRSLSALLLFFAVLAQFTPVRAEDGFLDPQKAFAFAAALSEPDELSIHFRIAPGYYMYRDRFEFQAEPESDALGAPVFPDGIVKYDPTFDQDMEVYHDQVTVRLPLAAEHGAPFDVRITSQGCADAGLCYPPMTHVVQLVPTSTGYEAQGTGVQDEVPPPAPQRTQALAAPEASLPAWEMGDADFAAWLGQAGLAKVMGLSLLLGLLLSFTPCVLPMVPILLAIIAGGPESAAAEGRRLRGLTLAAVYVLGMSLVYTALGVAAGLLGAGLSAWLQTPWVLAFFALLLAVLALPMFDVFTLQVPAGMQGALQRGLARIPGGRHGGAFVMGMVSALIVGPCVAAPLAGVLLFISQTADVVLGGAALFALAWGQGLLLLLVGAFSAALLPKAGPWMEDMKRFFGILLLGTAWWMAGILLPAWLAVAGWALLALWLAVLLRTFEPLPASPSVAALLAKACGLFLAVWALAIVVGLAAGGRDVLRPLAPFVDGERGGAPASETSGPPIFERVASVQDLDRILAESDRPVMLDFYADWCVSCVQMERFTFSDPVVQRRLARLTLVQADVTANSPEDRALLRRFNLFGPPGIIFFDAGGRTLPERVIGFRNAAQFAKVLDRVLQEP